MSREPKQYSAGELAAEVLMTEIGRSRAKARALYDKSLSSDDRVEQERYMQDSLLEREIARRLETLAKEVRKYGR